MEKCTFVLKRKEKKRKKENSSQLVETIELLQQLLVIYWIIHLDVFRIDYSAENHKIVILTLRFVFTLIDLNDLRKFSYVIY